MTAPKHTPGPWELETVDPGAEWHIHAPTIGFADGRWDSMAIIYGDDDVWEEGKRAEGHANAYLIASAPDLLAALTALVGVIDDSSGVIDYRGNGNFAPWSELPAMAQAQQAIAKATGGEG